MFKVYISKGQFLLNWVYIHVYIYIYLKIIVVEVYGCIEDNGSHVHNVVMFMWIDTRYMYVNR